MISANRHRSAFTMIELVIVMAILPITTLAMVGLINAVGSNRVQTEGRMDVEEASARTLSLWRQDVSAATAVRVSREGRMMSVDRIDAAGKRYMVIYTLTNQGKFIRVIQKTGDAVSPLPQTLVEKAAGVNFSKIGEAYQIQWTSEYGDGLHTRRWNLTGFAAPLLAQEG